MTYAPYNIEYPRNLPCNALSPLGMNLQASELGLDLIAYEGGQHLAGVGEAENNEILTEKFMAANRHPRMQQIYLEYLTRWRQAGGKTFCLYRNMGSYGRSGSWGILEHYGQDPLVVPKYRAVKQFNETAGRWWEHPSEVPQVDGECLIDFSCTRTELSDRNHTDQFQCGFQ